MSRVLGAEEWHEVERATPLQGDDIPRFVEATYPGAWWFTRCDHQTWWHPHGVAWLKQDRVHVWHIWPWWAC